MGDAMGEMAAKKPLWHRWWTWNGERLARPDSMARRLLAWPVVMALRVLLFVAVAAGWGLYEARDYWDRTQ